jgi:integrase
LQGSTPPQQDETIEGEAGMSGTIHKDEAKGTYWFIVDLGRKSNRKRNQVKRRGFKTKKAADQAMTALKAEYESGGFVDPSNQTLAEHLDDWLGMVRPSVEGSTFQRYETMARINIKPVLGHLKLQELKTRHIDEAYNALLDHGRYDGEGGLAPKTIRNIHGILSFALKKAVTWKLIPNNPASDVTLPKVKRAEMTVLTKRQSAELLAGCEGHWLHPIVFLALMTGMRRGEIAALRWANVNLDGGSLLVVEAVEETKGDTRFKEVKTSNGRRRISLPQIAVEY